MAIMKWVLSRFFDLGALPEIDVGSLVALDSSESSDRGIGVGLAKPIEQIPCDG